MTTSQPSWPRTRLTLVTIAVGSIAGASGVLVSLLLRLVQHVAYGYPAGHVAFVDGVTAAGAHRRLGALCVAGIVAAFGWWALDRYGRARKRSRVSIEQALAADPPRMPIATTLVHATLQIVTVALGSPLGREVAPREVGAAFAGWLSSRSRLALTDARLMVACGAGAGLAAVYNVPFAGALFTMEVLLRSYAWRSLVPAVATAAIATGVSRLCLGNGTQYEVPGFVVDGSLVPGSLIAWSLVAGPLLGIAAFAFRRVAAAMRSTRRDHDAWTIVLSLVVFAGIGLLAGPFPELLGNGKGPAQMSFDAAFTGGSALVVLALKVVVVCAAIRAGAYGGLLTPGIACGALLAAALGRGWSMWWSGPAPGAYAMVGAPVFLAVSMAMPWTAVVLLFEMTGMSPAFVAPIAVGVAGATTVARLCAKRWPVPASR